MTAEARKRPPTPDDTPTGGESELRHYTPEELVDPNGKFRLPTTPRMIREWAYQRRFTRSRMGGKVTLRLSHIREFVEQFDEPALTLPGQHKRPAA